jgi:hypothetical protein
MAVACLKEVSGIQPGGTRKTQKKYQYNRYSDGDSNTLPSEFKSIPLLQRQADQYDKHQI